MTNTERIAALRAEIAEKAAARDERAERQRFTLDPAARRREFIYVGWDTAEVEALEAELARLERGAP